MPATPTSAKTLLWFKRDLRLGDHAAVCAASEAAEMVAVFVWEPGVHGTGGYAVDDCSWRHRRFIVQSLDDLVDRLRRAGGDLLELQGDAVEALAAIHAVWPFGRVVSHQETGNAATFGRDRRVAEWCRVHNVGWDEFTQDGVVRRLRSRNGWARRSDHVVIRWPWRPSSG